MPCIVELTAALKLYVYANDHAPPHFHILSPDGDAQVELKTLQIMAGSVRRPALALAIAWASDAANYARLYAEWSRLNERD